MITFKEKLVVALVQLIRDIHPFFAATVPILLFYVCLGINQEPVEVIIVPLVVAVFACAVVTGLLTLCLRNAEKAALISTLLWCFFYALTMIILLYSAPDSIIGSLQQADCEQTLLYVSWLVLLWSMVLVLMTQRRLKKITSAFNQIGLFFFCLELLIIGSHLIQVYVFEYPKVAEIYPRQDEVALPKVTDKPDIYYIILDEMASSTTLRKLFGYDNTAFIKELERIGFFVPANSHSNYPYTRLSLASSLNMTYLDGLSKIASSGSDTADWSLLNEMIRDNKVERVLKRLGYKYIHIGSGDGPTFINPRADENIPTSPFTYSLRFLHSTAFEFTPWANSMTDDELRHQGLRVFDALTNVAGRTGPGLGPKFVFAHILLPHAPFLFGPDGESQPNHTELEGEQWDAQTKAGYLNQAKFTEKKVLWVVNQILAQSKTKPVIIIQGDHGPNSSGLLTKRDASQQLLVERFSIFNAYRFPPQCRGELYDTITPVNSFRALFHCLFKMPYQRLDDRMYFTPYPHPFQLRDETETTLSNQP